MNRTRVAALASIGSHGSMKAAAIFAAAAAITLLIPLVEHVFTHALAMAMLFLVVAAAWKRWQEGRFDAFETILVIGFLYFVFFGLGSVWTLDQPERIGYGRYLAPYVPVAAFYCLLGMVALMIGYFGPWFTRIRRKLHEDVPVGIALLVLPGAIGFLGCMAAAAWARAGWMGVSLPGIFSSAGQFAPLFYFSWGLGWLLVLSGRASPRQRWVLYGGLTPAAAIIVLSNLASKSLVMTVAGVPLMALWYARRKLPWRTLLVLALLLIFVVFPFYNNFRNLDARIRTADRAELTLNMMQGWDSRDYLDHSIGEFKNRMALVNSVAVVVRDVGRWVPFENGNTLFLPAVAYFVPRILWEDKPPANLGRRFGETFRVIHILDKLTSVEPTVPGELYWNFALPGIVIGMAFWGFTLRWFYRRYGERLGGLDPVARAVHMILLIDFVHFGGGMAVHYVTSIRTLILIEGISWFSRRVGWLRRTAVQG